MAKGSGKVPGSKAFRKYFLRPSILFPSGTKAEMEDGAGEVGRVTEHSLPSLAALVREQAGERLPQVADGFSLGLVFAWGPTLGGVRCAEAVSQGLGFVEMGVGWCWLLGLFTLLGSAAALHRWPGL